eukprot:gene2537-4946_t
MAAPSCSDDPRSHVKIKMMKEISDGHPYDALQYIQSFIARKKKSFGRSLTSSLIIYSSQLLIECNHAFEAGALLNWYINGGAGEGYSFHLTMDISNDCTDSSNNPCDLESIISLLSSFSRNQIVPVIDAIYSSLLKLLKSKGVSIGKSSNSYLSNKLETFEMISADVFELTKNWSSAAKIFIRWQDAERAVIAVDLWAKEGYTKEYPLFFARVVFEILSENRVEFASKFIMLATEAHSVLSDDSTVDKTWPMPCPYKAVWHLAVILTELASLTQINMTEKQKMFEILHSRYYTIVAAIDAKSASLLLRIAEFVFQLKPRGAPANPMSALFGNLLSGGAGGGNGLSQLMKMLG